MLAQVRGPLSWGYGVFNPFYVVLPHELGIWTLNTPSLVWLSESGIHMIFVVWPLE